MNRLISPLLVALATTALALTIPACGKKAADPPPATAPTPDEPKPDEPKPDEPEPDEPKPDEPKPDEPKPDEATTYIKFDVDHHDDKGIVTGHFERFEVVRANVDLSDPSKASAVVHIDLASVKTGIPKRDAHVISPDFFDVATFSTATLTVDGVTAAEVTDVYNANATLDFKGVTRSFPVSFKVVEKKDDGSIIIEGEHKGLARADFNVGADPETTNVAAVIETVRLRLHLANKE